jgi:RNA polymerase sigma factor (sigma-70 family)
VLVNANAAWWRRRSASEVPVRATPDTALPDATVAVAERHRLLAALHRLPARQRAALVLRFYDDLGENETARIMGCSVGSVKRHTSRGLERLRRDVDGEPLAALRPRPEVEPFPAG